MERIKINPMMELSYKLRKDRILGYDNILHIFKVTNQFDDDIVEEIRLMSGYSLTEKEHMKLSNKTIIDLKSKTIFVPYIKK